MNLKDFLDRNPELLKRLQECKTEMEFTALAEANGMKFGAGKVKEAFNVIKRAKKNGEIAEDELGSVSGGTSLQVTSLSMGLNDGKNTFLIT